MNQKIKRSIKEIDIKSKIYYIGVILLALAAVIAGIVTKGETVKNVLFNHDDVFMDFFNSAIDVLQTLVIALGGGLCVWGGINLLEGYGQDNPAANAHGW